jgi:glutamate carboxypeptidase
MDGEAAPALVMVDAQSADPADDRRDRIGPGSRRHDCSQLDERMAARVPLAIPGAPAPDGQLELDHRFEPVDVGSLEQADLDQSHGQARIPMRRRGIPVVPARTMCRCGLPASSVARIATIGIDARVDSTAPMTTTDPTTLELDALRAAIALDYAPFIADLRHLVSIDCGSYTPDGVNEVGRFVAGFLTELGADVDIRPDPEERFGNTVVATFRGSPGGARVLMLGHMDTVFEAGTVAARPFRMAEGIAHGPGVTDMKAGLLAGLYALKAVIASIGGLPFERLVFIANPDEEVGSPSSRPFIVEAARDVDAALALECARANGDIVSARKGIMDVRLVVHGRAAHAGVEPENGRSAVLEAARFVRALHDLNGRWDGVTVNVGAIHGGSRPNIVPDRCEIVVDVRSPSAADLGAVDAAIRALASATEIPETTVEVERLASHAPMEKTPRSARLAGHAQDVAGRLGFAVRDAATGGAGDANTTAGLGVPTLDGLGPVGGNDHAPTEYLEVDSIVPRTTLLAGLLLAIARDPEILAWRGTDPRFAGEAG